ncbi:hypothetical protein Lbir_1353 [Legionella birminghamensis]|uniref:Uncharacterized protein n=1 Tax=Legionella birminghamensis TaxID=28083 RepID=A0A378IDB8_9GAMM|nr:hypothetical protein Lbir_1353 [Legionella birminghamensis]STX32850.1 Uncharacterised protein [Legionella birminghamensis]
MPKPTPCFVYRDPCYPDYRQASLSGSFPNKFPAYRLDITTERMESLLQLKLPAGLNPNGLFKRLQLPAASNFSKKQWVMTGRMSIYNPVGIRKFKFI